MEVGVGVGGDGVGGQPSAGRDRPTAKTMEQGKVRRLGL